MNPEDADTPVIVDGTPKVFLPPSLRQAYPLYLEHLRLKVEREVVDYFDQIAAHFAKRKNFTVTLNTSQPERPRR